MTNFPLSKVAGIQKDGDGSSYHAPLALAQRIRSGLELAGEQPLEALVVDAGRVVVARQSHVPR